MLLHLAKLVLKKKTKNQPPKKLHEFVKADSFYKIWILKSTKTMMLTQTVSPWKHLVAYLYKNLDPVAESCLPLTSML